MEWEARSHVPALTALLSAISLALVFVVVLQAVPAWALPPASETLVAVIPPLNAAISAVAIVVITSAWRAIRQGNVARHRAGMLVGVVLFVTFLVLYLYRVAHEGPTAFPGPETVYRFVYLPILAIHMLLAIVTIPLLYYVLLLAGTRSIPEIRTSNHPQVGRVAVSLWLVSVSLGIVVYGLLYVIY